MAKPKTSYQCKSCGATTVKWMGQCMSCHEWNTLEEIVEYKESAIPVRNQNPDKVNSGPILLQDVQSTNVARHLIAFDKELERVLGGGIVPGSIILIGGHPGIGKSTLMLQLACRIRGRVLYISGEESPQQIKMRADRMALKQDSCKLLPETNLTKILKSARSERPDILMIDSIQTVFHPEIESSAGSITQIRECTSALQQFAKSTDIPVFIIGHITKEGSLAGPKVLEHIVDVVLQFEGDRNHQYRILRTIKNRFGSTEELGIYEMQSNGLIPVANPSELFLSQSEESLIGSAVGCTLEGARPLLIECQALVSNAIYGNPQRSVTGYDLRRLNMLLAVLEKKCGLFFGQKDVFLNLAGGIKTNDPAIDLAVVAALVSSLKEVAIDKKTCFAGEVGLSGEVRTVNRIDYRIQETNRLGFQHAFVSKFHKKKLIEGSSGTAITTIGNITELVHHIS